MTLIAENNSLTENHLQNISIDIRLLANVRRLLRTIEQTNAA